MIHSERQGNVTLITFDRPERKNALSYEDVDGFAAAVREAVDRNDTRALVLTGTAGDFCAGADLQGAVDSEFVSNLLEVLGVLRGAPFPTIAAVEGYALGAGTQIAVACDLRVASASARFGIPAAKLGLMIDQWTVQRLAHIAGQGAARAILLGCDILTCEQALNAGLVQRLGTLEDALEWAHHIATLAPLTIAGHKLGLNQSEPLASSTPEFDAAFRRAWESEDLKEGLSAFREHRPPQFEGR